MRFAESTPRIALGLAWSCVTVAALLSACEGSSSDGSDVPSSGGGPAASSSSTGGGDAGDAGGGGAGGSGGGALVCTGMPTSTVPVGECDVLQQDCPEGMGCEPVQSGDGFETACVSGTGLKGVQAECTDHEECQAGLSCLFGFCAPPCCPETNEPCQGGTCNAILDFGDHYVQYCSYLVTCEIFTLGACDSGQDCHILNGEGYAVCVDPSPSMKEEGEACMYLNECGPMQTCWPPGEPGAVCRYHCSKSSPGARPGLGGCPAGQICGTFPVGIDDVGVCIPS